jgi:hypothetical protein
MTITSNGTGTSEFNVPQKLVNYINTLQYLNEHVMRTLLPLQEEQKMEELKNYDPENLAEAKRQVEEQRNTDQVLKAKAEYLRLINKKELLEREIKNFIESIENREVRIAEIEAELKVFDVPKKKKRK